MTRTFSATADRLADSQNAKRTASKVSQLDDEDRRFFEREESFFSDFSRSDPPPTIQKLRSQLGLDELQQRAADAMDSLDALAARRRLASTFVRASFYEPGRYLAQGDTLKALTLYALAQSIHPENAQLCAERDAVYRNYALRKSVAPELGCDRR